jgi:hypothetical protein
MDLMDMPGIREGEREYFRLFTRHLELFRSIILISQSVFRPQPAPR